MPIESGVSIEGLSKLYQKPSPELLANIDLPVFTQPQTIRPLVRGVSLHLETSMVSLLDTNPVIRWSQLDRIGFAEVATRDRTLGSSLQAINELITSLDSLDNLNPDTKQLLTLALTEKTAEAAALGEAYLPLSARKTLARQHWGSGGWQYDRHVLEELAERFKFEISELIQTLKEAGVNALTILRNAVVPLFHWIKWEPAQKPDTHNSPGSNGEAHSTSHPLLESVVKTGEKRARSKNKKQKKRQKDALIYEPGNPANDKNVFVITKIYNQYDPQTGLLTVKAPTKTPELFASDSLSSENSQKIYAPIGKIDAIAFDEIGLPIPVEGSIDLRINRPSQRSEIKRVEVIEEGKDSNLFWFMDIRPFIKTDALGNTVLSLKDMPKDMRRKLNGKKLMIQTEYAQTPVESIIQRQHDNVEWIGPMPESEMYRLNLCPKEIANFIKTLKLRKEKGRLGSRWSNDEIFTRLTQFLGNFWLTYDEADSIFDKDDPVGFHQTERVLAHRIASCQGSNIALGQLMRYFLDEGEGIAYVDGFDVVNGVASHDERHLKVVYKEKEGRQIFFDATAWSQKDHEYFERVAGKYDQVKHQRTLGEYSQAKGEWIDRFPIDGLVIDEEKHKLVVKFSRKGVRQRELELGQALEESQQRLENAWCPPVPDDQRLRLENALRIFSYKRLENMPGSLGDKAVAGDILDSLIKVRIEDAPLPQRFDGNFAKCTNLVAMLETLNGVDAWRELWDQPKSPIDGRVTSNLKFLTHWMYKSPYTRMDAGWYVDGTLNKRAMLSDESLRGSLYDKMERVYDQAMSASVQNVSRVNQLSAKVEAYSRYYQSELKSAFSLVSDKLGGDPDEFFSGAPFMLLLPHPLSALDGYFWRELKADELGFLSPAFPLRDTMMGPHDRRIEDWMIQTDVAVSNIRSWLKDAPITRPGRAVSEVSSTYLWEQIEVRDKDQAPPEEPIYLDPIQTFLYLYSKMDPKEQVKEQNAPAGVRMRALPVI